MTRDANFEWRDVPAELHKWLPEKLYWIKSDTGAWGDWPRHGPITELHQYGEKWLSFCRNKRNVIQAGGNCGMYARFYTKFFKKVYSFEPDPNNFNCLKKNTEGTNAQVNQLALGDRETVLKLKINSLSNVGTHTISSHGDDVDAISIDSLGLNDVDLIHLDLETYEPVAIRGAVETIKRCRPVIISECDIIRDLNNNGLNYNFVEKLQDHVYVPF